MPRPKFPSKNIQARLRIDPRSLEEHNRKLRKLAAVTRKEVVKAALLKGGGLIQSAAEAKAPGPHIGIEVLTGAQLGKSVKGVKPEALYVAIGPDKQHWYYRFEEFGVKAHGVKRRKRTRYQQYLGTQGVRIGKARRYATGAKQKRTTGQTRPAMVFTLDGRLIFARKVRGFAAKPFLRPAADSQGPAAIQALGRELAREIEKAAKS
jgi:HK97 gp10 family phage protein